MSSIIVDYQGLRGTKRITVNPNYGGTWQGMYQVLTCTQTGAWVAENLCATPFTVNALLPHAMILTHLWPANVSGQTALGGLVSGSFTGTVAANGSLPFTAKYTNGTLTGDETWLLNCTQDGKFTGTMTVTFRDSTMLGEPRRFASSN